MISNPVSIRCDQVSLVSRTSNQPLLHNISFAVQPGDRLSIVGATGAGKTTLLRLLNRLHDPTSGSIYLDGQDLRSLPPVTLRQRVTLVPQTAKLLGMTAQEALIYPLILRGLPRPTIQQRLATWLEQLHIPQEWLERTEVQLSAGQRQLVAIARALMTHPPILLLDEPTSALDAEQGIQVIRILIELSQTQATTILMVNHQLDLAQIFAQQVLHLHQGEIMQHTSAAQMDWATLQTALLEAESQAAQEWGD